MNQATKDQLDALYATLPTIECQRKCQDSCGPILIFKIEVQRLEERRGFLETVTNFEPNRFGHLPAPEDVKPHYIGLKPEQNLDCVFLAPMAGSCTCYKIRPLVCRAWGLVNNQWMRCPFGCVPSRWLSDEEFRDLNYKVIAIQKGEST